MVALRQIVMGPVLLSIMLAGCTVRDREFESASRPPPPHPAERQQRGGPAEAPTPPRELPIPARKPAGTALLAARTDLDPERLIGLSLVETEALLGEPALQDEKPPAKVWTYNAQSCVLSIFFYADISTRDFRALTYEITNGNDAKQEETSEAEEEAAEKEESKLIDRQCLAELITEHAT